MYFNTFNESCYNAFMDTSIYRTQPCPHCGAFTNRGTSVDMDYMQGDRFY